MKTTFLSRSSSLHVSVMGRFLTGTGQNLISGGMSDLGEEEGKDSGVKMEEAPGNPTAAYMPLSSTSLIWLCNHTCGIAPYQV